MPTNPLSKSQAAFSAAACNHGDSQFRRYLQSLERSGFLPRRAIRRRLVLVGVFHMVLDIVGLALSAAVAGDTILYKALVTSSSMNLVLSVIILGDNPEHAESCEA